MVRTDLESVREKVVLARWAEWFKRMWGADEIPSERVCSHGVRWRICPLKCTCGHACRVHAIWRQYDQRCHHRENDVYVCPCKEYSRG